MRPYLIATALPLLAACEMPVASDNATTAPAAPAATAAAPVAGEPAMPPGLTPDQRVIWNGMTPQAKRDAIAYMEAGGTFGQFIAV